MPAINCLHDSDFAGYSYELLSTRQYRPVSMVEYERRAYTHEHFNTRVTLDNNLRYCPFDYNLFSHHLNFQAAMPKDETILEIKYDRFLFKQIQEALRDCDLSRTPPSKYGTSRSMMLVYRACQDSMGYNRRFNMTLMMITLASTMILYLIQNNPMLSLGALGSLSICRLRANTKDPRDLGFVFWSMAIGISSAIGAFFIGSICTVTLGIVMLTIGRTVYRRDMVTMVVRGQKEKVFLAEAFFTGKSGCMVQSKNIFHDSFELVYDLKISKQEVNALLAYLNNLEGIHGVNILAPNTEVA